MKLFVPRESDPIETRVAASPETVKKLAGLGFEVTVEAGAGAASRIPDSAYEAAGANIGAAKNAGDADVVLRVRRPSTEEAKACRKDALVLAMMDPYGHEDAVEALAKAGLRHGIHAAHHARSGHGRSVEPGESRRLPGGDRSGVGL
jgi:NAD(P) transhydrogenase subunit alpha